MAQNAKASFIYLFSCANYYKLGIAQNPAARLCGIQTGNPFEVKMARVFRVQADAAYFVEQTAHRALGKYNVRGEWFSAPEEILVAAIEKAISQFDAGLAERVALGPPARPYKKKNAPKALGPKCKVCGSKHWGRDHVFPPPLAA